MPGRPFLFDITGQRFGKLLVKGPSDKKNSSGHILWECICDCGNTHFAKSAHLRKGGIKSCGCSHYESIAAKVTRHGFSHTPIHTNWMGMISRCTNPKNISWPNYGGRGITITPEWMVFENFLKDMPGWEKGKSLERIDVNKGYSKENCVWIDRKLQARNTRRNLRITYRGETRVFSEWCEKFNLPYNRTYTKYRKGLALDLVFNE